jgi:hypothetical protein
MHHVCVNTPSVSYVSLLGFDVAFSIDYPHMLNCSPVRQDEAVVSALTCNKVQLANENSEAKLEENQEMADDSRKPLFKLNIM